MEGKMVRFLCQAPEIETSIFPKKCRLTKKKYDMPAKFDIGHEKCWLENNFPIGKVTFQGLC